MPGACAYVRAFVQGRLVPRALCSSRTCLAQLPYCVVDTTLVEDLLLLGAASIATAVIAQNPSFRQRRCLQGRPFGFETFANSSKIETVSLMAGNFRWRKRAVVRDQTFRHWLLKRMRKLSRSAVRAGTISRVKIDILSSAGNLLLVNNCH